MQVCRIAVDLVHNSWCLVRLLRAPIDLVDGLHPIEAAQSWVSEV